MNSDGHAHVSVGASDGIDSTIVENTSTTMGTGKRTELESAGIGNVRHRGIATNCHRKNACRGFTLVELLIVVVIIGIIAAIAVPSYSLFIINANRTDAMSFLSEVAGEQQRYFSENNEYADEMSDLGYGTDATFPSPEGHYTISVSNTTDANLDYVLSATPVVGGRQAKDDECDVFTISSTGVKANTGGSNANCW